MCVFQSQAGKNMAPSLWVNYVKEREGSSVIEEPWGFIEYKLVHPFMRIETLYVVESQRQNGFGSELADRVADLAREAECTHLWAKVWVGALNATESLKAILAYGFTVNCLDGDCIILTKQIGGV